VKWPFKYIDVKYAKKALELPHDERTMKTEHLLNFISFKNTGYQM